SICQSSGKGNVPTVCFSLACSCKRRFRSAVNALYSSSPRLVAVSRARVYSATIFLKWGTPLTTLRSHCLASLDVFWAQVPWPRKYWTQAGKVLFCPPFSRARGDGFLRNFANSVETSPVVTFFDSSLETSSSFVALTASCC